MSRYVLPLLAVIVLIAFLVIGLTRGDPRALPSPYIGKPAPEFELPTLKDASVTVGSEDFRGQLILVNVWATWCVQCRVEHQFLMDLAASGTIPIYGINWRDTRPEALRWLQQLGDPYIASGFDVDGVVGIDWGVYGAPESFLVSADGVVLYKQLGPLSQDIWEREFVPLMASGGSTK
jgi:cytochrome c biogenesis protein CcmG/thiol:disulfide interchange protein DsbE